MSPPPSSRAFACGVTGTGKTHLLRELWIERAPRVLLLDHLGEWGAPDAFDLRQLVERLRQAAGRDRWRIVASLDPEEVAKLAEILIPFGDARGKSFAAAVGGMALALDEADQLAGRSCDRRISGLWRRGRHVGLSIYAATQRPADVHRAVTSQSQWIAVTKVYEPRDMLYLSQLLTPDAMDALGEVPQYGALLWEQAKRSGYIVDAGRHILRHVGTPRAEPTTARARAPGSRG